MIFDIKKLFKFKSSTNYRELCEDLKFANKKLTEQISELRKQTKTNKNESALLSCLVKCAKFDGASNRWILRFDELNSTKNGSKIHKMLMELVK